MIKYALFPFIYFWTKLFFLILIFSFKKLNSEEMINFQVFYLSEDMYLIIDAYYVYFYYSITENRIVLYALNENQTISSVDELEMISFGKFKNSSNAHLFISKNYVYSYLEYNKICILENEQINNYKSEIFPLKYSDDDFYYIIGIINSEKDLVLYLYHNKIDESKSNLIFNFTIGYTNSENFSCQLMKSHSFGEVLTCFYENKYNEIVANSLTIDITNPKIESAFLKPKTNNKAKIIKSKLSQDETKSFVCYINENYNCACLTYMVIINDWSDNTIYINSCLSKRTTLFFDYYELSNQYFLYCYETTTKINILKLNENLNIISKYSNDTYDYVKSCSKYYLSSLNYNSNDDIQIFGVCQNFNNFFIGKFQNISTMALTTLPETIIITTISEITIPIRTTTLTTTPQTIIPAEISIITNTLETTIPASIPNITSISEKTIYTTTPILSISTSLPFICTFIDFFEEQNKFMIYQKNLNKTKEEIINNLDNAMLEYEINKIYELFGDDYNIKISPININIYKNISTFIDFSNCEKILREKNELSLSSILTIYQIEIENPNEQSLINDIEFAVFNDKKERLDLSVCKEETIQINHQINTSKINMTKVNYYSELGIDVFNIEDEFFNDICYSYSENNSDMILKDRVSDIFQNYSICENNCKYNKINLTDNIVSCNCSVKIIANADFEKPKLATIIRDSFTDSNIGVMKCYNLVFNFKNKINNIGFCIFTILVISHIPLFIYYFIFNIIPIRIYIFSEMTKFHYSYNVINPVKRDKNYNKKKNIKIINNSKDKKILNNEIKISTNVGNNNSSSFQLNKNKNFITEIKSRNKNNERNKFKKGNNILLLDYKIYNKNYINISPQIKSDKKTKDKSHKLFKMPIYSLIQIDANNTKNNSAQNSDILLDNYDYENAIKYDKRSFIKILYICILAKENIINIFFFRTPLDIPALRICLFIFSYSCDLAFNTIFFTNENISEKYHYKGENLFLFSLVNNLIQSIISSFVGLILVNTFQHLIDFRADLENIFRKEEKKM